MRSLSDIWNCYIGTRVTVRRLEEKLRNTDPRHDLGVRMTLDRAKRALETLAWVLDMEQCELDKHYYSVVEPE